MEKLLSIKQVAEVLGVSVFTIRMEIYRRRLACVSVWRRILIDPKDLAEYKAANRTPAKLGAEA